MLQQGVEDTKPIRVHLVDGTYELFRAYYGAPSRIVSRREVGASRSLFGSLLKLLTTEGATHLAVAFDHVIESFRNQLFEGYKTGDGIDPGLYGQFALAEQVTEALGIVCWPMVDFEADDALATGAAAIVDHDSVEQVRLCSPDKDLMQCVHSDRVVVVDRRREIVYDEAAVIEKLGVRPQSIPDYLALVGDTADGIPGVPKWGAKSAARVLQTYGTLDAIPESAGAWKDPPRGKDGLAQSLIDHRKQAQLYKTLATLRTDVPVDTSLEVLAWRGADRSKVKALEVVLGEGLEKRVPRFMS